MSRLKNKKKKVKNKRDSHKNPGLNPSLNPKNRKEYNDADYLHLLDEKTLRWYNQFIEEEINASFKYNKNDFNKTDEEKRAIYHKNNARNRCMYSIARTIGKLDNIEDYINLEDEKNENEDLIIDKIDFERAELSFKNLEQSKKGTKSQRKKS